MTTRRLLARISHLVSTFPKEVKLIANIKSFRLYTPRQWVGLVILILGLLSIPVFRFTSGESFFTRITYLLQPDIFFMYFFLIISFIHKLAMILDTRQQFTGNFSVFIWVAMSVIIAVTPYAYSGPAPSLIQVLPGFVIFFGWFITDLIDSLDQI